MHLPFPLQIRVRVPNLKYRPRPKPTPPEEVMPSYIVPKTEKVVESHKRQVSMLEGMKEEVYTASLVVLKEHLGFRDIDPYQPMEESDYYKGLVQERGVEEAKKAYRLAEAGWRTAATAPVGIKNAMHIAIGIMKSEAKEKSGPRIINVGKVLIDQSLIPQFEEREIE